MLQHNCVYATAHCILHCNAEKYNASQNFERYVQRPLPIVGMCRAKLTAPLLLMKKSIYLQRLNQFKLTTTSRALLEDFFLLQFFSVKKHTWTFPKTYTDGKSPSSSRVHTLASGVSDLKIGLEVIWKVIKSFEKENRSHPLSAVYNTPEKRPLLYILGLALLYWVSKVHM